ncbi:hypothetical protein CL658_01610 [bacterium]|nr:hypothetical protein [bacterium]
MKKKFRDYVLLLIFFFTVSFSYATSPGVEVIVSPNTLFIGDVFTYSIKLTLSKNTSLIKVPKEFDIIKGNELSFINSRVTKSMDDQYRYITLAYDLQIFDITIQTIPTQNITIKTPSYQQVSVPSLPLRINSIKSPDVTDIQLSNHIFVNTQLNWIPVILLILGVILSCFGLFKLITYVKHLGNRNKIGPVTPIQDTRTPYEIAVQDLLANFNKRHAISLKDYYVHYSDIIKTYLTTILSVKNIEMTSYEMLTLCYDRFNEQDYRRIKKVLNFSDSVKFAKNPASDDDNQLYYQKALDCIQSIHVTQSKEVISSDVSHPTSTESQLS